MRICEKFAAVTAFRFHGADPAVERDGPPHPSPLPEERENRRPVSFQSDGHPVGASKSATN